MHSLKLTLIERLIDVINNPKHQIKLHSRLDKRTPFFSYGKKDVTKNTRCNIYTYRIRAFTFSRRHPYPLTWVHTWRRRHKKLYVFLPGCWKLRFNGDTGVAGCSWRLKLPSDRRCTRWRDRRALARQRYHFISDPAGGLASALTVGVKKNK